MSRVLTVGAAQMGPIQLADARPEVVERLVALLRSGAAAGCDLVVFPELALTTFFPRWWVDDLADADHSSTRPGAWGWGSTSAMQS